MKDGDFLILEEVKKISLKCGQLLVDTCDFKYEFNIDVLENIEY